MEETKVPPVRVYEDFGNVKKKLTTYHFRNDQKVKMNGLFAQKDIKPYTRLAIYQGKIMEKKKYDSLVSKHPEVSVYSAEIPGATAGTIRFVVPQQTNGIIFPKYDSEILYANEPSDMKSGKQKVNAAFCFNYDDSVLEVIAIKKILKGEEVLLYYGPFYDRSHYSSKPVVSFKKNGKWQFFISFGYMVKRSHDNKSKPSIVRTLSEVNHPPSFIFDKKKKEYIIREYKNK